jgi:hypothetical protein
VLDVLVLLSIADRACEHERLAWVASVDEQWSRLYGDKMLAPETVVSIRAEIARLNADAVLARIEQARDALTERDHVVLVRIVFLMFAATGPMSLGAAERFIAIAGRLAIPFARLTEVDGAAAPPQILPSSTAWHAAA